MIWHYAQLSLKMTVLPEPSTIVIDLLTASHLHLYSWTSPPWKNKSPLPMALVFHLTNHHIQYNILHNFNQLQKYFTTRCILNSLPFSIAPFKIPWSTLPCLSTTPCLMALLNATAGDAALVFSSLPLPPSMDTKCFQLKWWFSCTSSNLMPCMWSPLQWRNQNRDWVITLQSTSNSVGGPWVFVSLPI